MHDVDGGREAGHRRRSTRAGDDDAIGPVGSVHGRLRNAGTRNGAAQRRRQVVGDRRDVGTGEVVDGQVVVAADRRDIDLLDAREVHPDRAKVTRKQRM